MTPPQDEVPTPEGTDARESWTQHYDPTPEEEATGLGTPGMWIRFAILLAVLLIPTLLLLRWGDRKVAQDGPVRGVHVWGAEVRTFQPCGGTVVYWVTGRDDLMGTLREGYRRIAEAEGLEPYAPVYVELSGAASQRRDSGFALNYDGTFDVVVVNEVRALREGECPSGSPPS